jgi:polyhydroxyalkanoate synthesis regulator phasin
MLFCSWPEIDIKSDNKRARLLSNAANKTRGETDMRSVLVALRTRWTPSDSFVGNGMVVCNWLARPSLVCATIVVGGCLSFADEAGKHPVENVDWVERSNGYTRPVLETVARYSPESMARLGLEGFDEAIIDLQPRLYERSREDRQNLLDQLKLRARDEEHPKIKQDLQILIQGLDDNLTELKQRQLLPYVNVAEISFEGIRALLNENVATARQPAALVRLRKYAGLLPDTKSITELAKERTTERFSIPGLLGPYRPEVQKDIAKAELYVKGIADLMREHKIEGWEETHKIFAAQIDGYTQWLKSEMLPRCRENHRLPAEFYANALKANGVLMSPQDLVERAQFGFMETRTQMAALAKRIAAERHLEKNGYKDVIAVLKREQLQPDDILPRYQQRLKEIEAIIRRERIVSLPKRDARIRFASPAESARIPAPSMEPPRLIGNTGEYGQFLIPLRNPTAESDDKMDDFLHDAITWSLTAHEARPGHEMQFSRVVENGTSMARAVFAWNAGNVEGWGLYSEAIMLEHEPLEGQFFTLYMRLLRTARAFLDPMVNQGEITPEAAKAFLMRELLLSEPMAAQEVDRYAFWMPGQATSYYYGFMKLQSLRSETELLLGANFDQLQFHDFILDQGLLPLDLLRKAVLEEFVPSHLKGG